MVHLPTSHTTAHTDLVGTPREAFYGGFLSFSLLGELLKYPPTSLRTPNITPELDASLD